MNQQRNETEVPNHLRPLLKMVRENEGCTSAELFDRMKISAQPSVVTNQLRELFDLGLLTRRWLGNAHAYFIARPKRG